MYMRLIRGFTSSHSCLDIERFIFPLEIDAPIGAAGSIDVNESNGPIIGLGSSNEKAHGKAAASFAAICKAGLSEVLMMIDFEGLIIRGKFQTMEKTFFFMFHGVLETHVRPVRIPTFRRLVWWLPLAIGTQKYLARGGAAKALSEPWYESSLHAGLEAGFKPCGQPGCPRKGTDWTNTLRREWTVAISERERERIHGPLHDHP